jgi:methionyl-tRNA formyltransferase
VIAIDRAGVRVACGRGSLELRTVKPDGGKPMSADAWARGVHLAPSARLETIEEDAK